MTATPRRILMLGASGTAGQATARALTQAGHDVVCLLRPQTRPSPALAQAEIRPADVTDPVSLRKDGIRGEPFDVLVSCLAARTGAPDAAWAIDHRAHVEALAAAKEAGITQMVLLSAICVQKPRLAFQQAKLAFEATLIDSGITYSIVRPTAFFKSLSGQIARVKAGKPFLVFGNGALTACKPISDADLGRYMASCVTDPDLHNRILPIGGPGPALTPRDQGLVLFELLGTTPRFRHVPVALMTGIIGLAATLGKIRPAWAQKADLARIGHYYATQSMLVLDPTTGQYSAEATPETGSDTLAEYYAAVIDGRETVDLGDHAVF